MAASRMSLPLVSGNPEKEQPGLASEQRTMAGPELADLDLRAVLQALPTCNGMEAMVSRLEEGHRREM